MRVPLEWLADYVDINLPTKDLADKLTMSGLKVESIEQVGENWHDVYIGHVVALDPHPSSNKPLHVARVDLRDRAITVVTGAQNVRLGDKVPVILVGGVLPHGPDGSPMQITSRPMAGILSEGMLASQRELGLSDEHEGIYVLPPDAPLGDPLRDYLGGDVLDIETNPNRPDTLSIIGIAREVAALTQQSIRMPDLEVENSSVSWIEEESIPVSVESPDLCPRYSALRIKGSQGGDSPSWMTRRLQAAGMRPISLLVDITNYVMLEFGQPMHAFDARQLSGGRIIVRRAHRGENLKTLDGAVRDLSEDMLVIADADRAVAIAGVMGGENSEIAPDTDTIVLESANFDAVSVRRTSKSLGLRTEASARFEKGLPPQTTVLGLKRYLQLLAGATTGPLQVARVSDAWVGEDDPPTVRMPMRDLHRLVGVPIPQDQAAEVLASLGFQIQIQDGAIEVTVPYWRRIDIEQSADVVEEVARLVGFDTVSPTLPRRTMPPSSPSRELFWEGRIRETLLASGLSEAVTHSLTSEGAMLRLVGKRSTAVPSETLWNDIVPNAAGIENEGALISPVRLLNPSTTERTVLRLTLKASLLDVIARNLRHTTGRVAFFEIARTFFHRVDALPYERHTLSIALSGNRLPTTWAQKDPGPYTFFDMKGMLEAVLHVLQVPTWSVERVKIPTLHPGRSAAVYAGGDSVAHFGEVHPLVSSLFEIEGWPVQLAEVDLDALFPAAAETHTFRPLPRYPAAYRDIAVVLDREISAEAVMDVIRSAGGDTLESARPFDVYEGASLGESQKSIAVEMSFRASTSTLTHEEVAASMQNIVAALSEQLSATLRE